MRVTLSLLSTLAVVSSYALAAPAGNPANNLEARQSTSVDYGESEASPLYNLWNNQSLDHLLTNSASEASSVVSLGYAGSTRGRGRILLSQKVARDQNNAAVAISVPFYRFYHPTLGNHAYAVGLTELIDLVGQGYSQEGVTGYVWSTQVPGTVPFYRAYNSAWTDWIYSTDRTEIDQVIREYNYVDRGIACYVFPLQPATPTPPAPPPVPSCRPKYGYVCE